jgi:hypothetical protein
MTPNRRNLMTLLGLAPLAGATVLVPSTEDAATLMDIGSGRKYALAEHSESTQTTIANALENLAAAIRAEC